MNLRTALQSVRRCGAAILVSSGVAACGFDEGLMTPYGGPGGGTAVVPSQGESRPSSYRGPAERSYVTPRGDMIFAKPRETTIVGRDGGVTVIQRDRDGTRTVVGSNGVRVIPPGTGYRRR